ncbi:RhoGAP-domain-containing protein [Teratosphaeria nubilosa]|uniref:RhoGAP-domain-containing protein n=1 Tax=Teratosphaeria nubilosa TaxID=161662 RepID=A0A6G1KUX0_9PEZI|nr:RhoGAP-domain-containing protein [Teratosphaeria nubilosa]
MSDEYNRSSLEANGATNGSAEPSSPDAPRTSDGPTSADTTASVPSEAPPKAVEDVMYSDIGINTLLNRLKQSIASARDFAAFLQKRSKLEEEQASGLKKLARAHLDTVKRSEMRGGSYAMQITEVMKVQERMGDNGMQFALSLHQMHEDLNALSVNMERDRKTWKHDGLGAEKKASDAEAAMQKAKSRYDSLAEDYDRARTGDTKGSRRIGLKGPKSAEQYESDLLRKVQAADADYEEKVRFAKAQREALLNDHRPRAVSALKELCRECDSGLTLQLQKFATFNEKLLLGNGLAVSPLTGDNTNSKSLRDVISDIDNDGDFHNYVGAYVSKITRPSDIKYEQHPTLAPKTQQPSSRNVSGGGLQSQPSQSSVQQPSLSAAGGNISQGGSTSSRYNAAQPPPGPIVAPSQPTAYGQCPTTFTSNSSSQPTYQSPPAYGGPEQRAQSPYNSTTAPSRDNYNSPPYPTGHGDVGRPPPAQSMGSSSGYGSNGHMGYGTTGTIPLPSQQRQNSGPPPPHSQSLPPLKPVFGVSLNDLLERDHTAVPMVVIQCILAVDHFGLEVEGIYRLSGTSSHVNMLKDRFNHDPSGVDFRNPNNFYHDVNSVATLLKQFFRDLPDPLFTRVGYEDFIRASKIEDENMRRDGLHQAINDLPDPNYATLRALVLHLHRVMQNEHRNRMGASNLALCFAPSLMGTHTNSQIADASYQARAVQTILENATAIFDED